MSDPLIDAWEINARIDRYLLDSIPQAALGVTPSSGGRTVGEVFAHLHNVRLMWLKASAPQLLAGLDKVEKSDAVSKAAILKALDSSAHAIAALVELGLQSGGRLKGFKPHVQAFVGYLVSHESHHRGQILLALKVAGMAVDKKVAYGLWEWGSR